MSMKFFSQRRPASPAVVLTLLAFAFLLAPTVHGRSSNAKRLLELHGCQPKSVPKAERCVYVREHATCRPEDGWIPYLEVHYCYLDQLEVASTTLFLLWIGVLFSIMLVVAERFFCPSLELISEYLRLPPCVAGATLLSFGNGAPDVFTQLAAISQGDSSAATSPDALAMALSEPLGSGLFVGNVVFGLVVAFSGVQEVLVQRSYFLKDCLFYLGGVAMVFGFLLHGQVTLWEVALLAAYYLTFIAVTILISRGDEPVHADPRLHEVPHRLRPADSFLRESFRRLTDWSLGGSDAGLADQDRDLSAPLLVASPPPAPRSASHRKSNPGLDPIDEAEPGTPGPGSSSTTTTTTTRPGRNPGTEANRWLLDLDPNLDPAEVRRQRQQQRSLSLAEPSAASLLDSHGRCGGGGAGGSSNGRISAATAAAAAAAAAAAPGAQLLAAAPCSSVGRTLSGGSGAGGPATAVAIGTATATTAPYGGGMRTLSGCSAVGGVGGGGDGLEGGGMPVFGRGSGSLDRGPSVRRQNSGRPPSRMELLWRRVEKPGLWLLSLFIPRVAIDSTHARYRKTTAVLLPPLLPTLVGWTQGWLDPRQEAPGGGFWVQPWWLISTGVGLAVAVLAVILYPQKGHLHGYAAGVATVVVFCEAMALLDGSAGELVSAAVALGQIYGISPSLLGATLLAWGNSVSDLVSNITLAMDGLPTMAITACFASPMFVLLAGLVTSLTYATRHGSMALPHDLALRVLYGGSTSILTMWALVVPLVFRFRLGRRVPLLAVGVYLAFQAVYITAVVHDSRASGAGA